MTLALYSNQRPIGSLVGYRKSPLRVLLCGVDHFGKIVLEVFVPRRLSFNYFSEDHVATAAPDDVMEGYFAVLAIKGEETKRFIVGLDYLNDPAFLGLWTKLKKSMVPNNKELLHSLVSLKSYRRF
ncbi:hypothetical protein D0Y65_026100 [Glycine soja]|uniref:Uncharacterized protein n=1 Tax=Glycine soja TaxID=3848 RepID=A0A445IIC5_GLYSO|nr:hypothetical protein D0Y65_026100 [Glycine soja]